MVILNERSSLVLEVLEYSDKKDTILKEQHYFDKLNLEYNVLKIAGSSKGFKHSKATIEKMKTVHLTNDQIRLNRSLARLGVKVSQSTCVKLSKITSAQTGVPVIVKNSTTNEEKKIC